MPPHNPRVVAGAAGGGRRVAAAGPRSGPASPSNRARAQPASKSHGTHDGDDDGPNDMLSSIAGLMEPHAPPGGDHPSMPSSSAGVGAAAGLASIGEAAESVGVTRALVTEFERLESDYSFLATSFAPSSRRPSNAADADPPTDSAASENPLSDRQTSAVSTAGMLSDGSGTMSFAAGDDDDRVVQSTEHLRRLSHDDLLQYSIRLTAIVGAFMAHERHRRERRRGNLDRSLDSDDDHDRVTRSEGDESDFLTASIRSIRLPPVKNTNQVRKATDFEGNKTINEYSIIAELGRGAYGKVKLAVNNATNMTCAIKIMKKSILKRGTAEQVVQREIAVMKKLRHRNVVPLFEVLDDPEGEKIYMVMKYVDNGTIVNVRSDLTCTPLAPRVAAKYMRQLISGLTYLHRRGVIHRDLKPDNVLIDTHGVVFLTDFGVSEIVATESSGISGTEGTPIFLAPELLSGEAGHVAGPPVDVWALGVTFYLAVFGEAPFKGKTWNAIAEEVTNTPVEFPPDADPLWADVLSKLLEKDPKKRLTLSKLKKHRLFDTANAELAAEAEARGDGAAADSVLDRAALKDDAEDDDDDDDSGGTSPLGIPVDVTEDEVRGSMRRLVTPIDDDASAFAGMPKSVKTRVSSFVHGLRGRLAEKRFAAVAGAVVSDGEEYEDDLEPEEDDDEVPDFTDDDPAPPAAAAGSGPKKAFGAKASPGLAAGSGPRAIRAVAAGAGARAGPRPPAGGAAASRNPRAGSITKPLATLEPISSSAVSDSPNLYSTAGAASSSSGGSGSAATSRISRRQPATETSATGSATGRKRNDPTPKLPAIGPAGGASPARKNL